MTKLLQDGSINNEIDLESNLLHNRMEMNSRDAVKYFFPVNNIFIRERISPVGEVEQFEK